MARVKIFAEIAGEHEVSPGEYSKVWVTQSVASKLDLKPKEDWLYMSKDWMGVLSTQALVEDIVEGEGEKIYLSADRMIDAHFKVGDKPKAWKLTEWE